MELSSLETTTQRTFGRLRLTGVNTAVRCYSRLIGHAYSKGWTCREKEQFPIKYIVPLRLLHPPPFVSNGSKAVGAVTVIQWCNYGNR